MGTSTASEPAARAARRVPLLATSACAALLALAACRAGAEPVGAPERFEYEEPRMGTLFRIVLYAAERARADAAAAAAFAQLERLDRCLSDYDEASELSRLSRASEGRVPSAWIPLSPELAAVLRRARAVSDASGGAFDVACGAATRLWRRALRERELPSAEELELARGACGAGALELEGERARWTRAGVRLDLGGIAKGYALDRMLEVLRAHGVTSALAVGGGDVVAGEPPPGASAWRVELLSPLAELPGTLGTLELARAAVATSGDLSQSAVIEGRRYSHLVDPRTGLALATPRGASVIAPDGAAADALATAAAVLGPERSRALWPAFPDCAFRAVEAGAECAESPGFWRRGVR